MLAHLYNLTIADSIIVATAIFSGYTHLLTTDPAFLRAQKEGKIKVVSLAGI
ncbi:hypothetical protein HYU13_01825 [Candidatus Woesearchaeota archaeon]|nr:hypothetical protein [Candidatus Woesearchaeota archaeon]